MKKIITSIAILLPSFSLAQTQTTSGIKNINDVALKASAIGNLVTELLVAIAVIYIIYSVVRYVIAGGEGEREKGGMNILWGVVGLFVILSIWGLVSLLTGTFRFQDNQRPDFDSIQLPNPDGSFNTNSINPRRGFDTMPPIDPNRLDS